MADKAILLVEDNESDELLTRRALKKNNITNELTVAHDGEEALNILFGCAERSPMELPALVLLDLKLPKVNGFEVLRQIRASERTKFMPVVILTASREESDIVNGYRSGANSYIRKPVDSSEFTEATKNIGIYWLSLNELPAK